MDSPSLNNLVPVEDSTNLLSRESKQAMISEGEQPLVIERIVMIESPTDAIFAKKFINNVTAVAYNSDYTAFATDATTVFVYSNATERNYIIEIFKDPKVLKLISRPAPTLKGLLRGNNYENTKNISVYINEVGDPRVVPEMKQSIMNQDEEKSLSARAAKVALLMMKYKIEADVTGKPAKKPKKSYFNKKRDCYLLYLTAYNDLLSRYGPMRFIDLTRRVRDYPYLCRVGLHPAMALEGLVNVGALSSDPRRALISIPDQLPRL